MEFENKVVIVTGGGSGIGKAAAGLFVQRGASAVVVGRNSGKLQETASQLDLTGARIAVLAGDIGKPDTAKQADDWPAKHSAVSIS